MIRCRHARHPRRSRSFDRHRRPAYETGGLRAVVAESALTRHQLLILTRSRERAPNLRVSDRIVAGLCTLLMHPSRMRRCGMVLKPSTLLLPSVLLGYSAEPEFCLSSSEFTAVAVPLALVSQLVLAGGGGWTDAPVARQPKSDSTFHGNRTRQLRAQPVIKRPDVRSDDEDRQLAAARPPAQVPAVAPTDSPVCPFPATGASESRDNTL